VLVNGDGKPAAISAYIANVVQANLKAATTTIRRGQPGVQHRGGGATSLNELLRLLIERLLPRCPHLKNFKPVHRDFREGDVRHSLADISKARRLLGYRPDYGFERAG